MYVHARVRVCVRVASVVTDPSIVCTGVSSSDKSQIVAQDRLPVACRLLDDTAAVLKYKIKKHFNVFVKACYCCPLGVFRFNFHFLVKCAHDGVWMCCWFLFGVLSELDHEPS